MRAPKSLVADDKTMFLQCKNIVEFPHMPKKAGPKMVQFTIGLPPETIELIERLPQAYYASGRSERARQLIQDQLKHLGAPLITEALKKPKRKKTK
jgi:hypothetical protein